MTETLDPLERLSEILGMPVEIDESLAYGVIEFRYTSIAPKNTNDRAQDLGTTKSED